MVKIRCAIYTRKSSEDGLDMDFNTLDAQREAGENYVLSQKHEGWILLPEHYDDGGFSGGNTNRPAFKKLMQDVESGLVDMIVVYKIDRLTRSLIDFSKMVEVFDSNKVSFVSVTQQFNTSTSMGRLTLNMLLSFAQFEREVSGERIRDKIAASKQKGMFMGGLPVLGYDIIERKLVINQNEAKIVKEIFNKYLQLHSYLRVAKDLNNQGFHTKQWQSKKGNFYGNRCFDKTVVASVIKNPVYIGKIKHKDKIYDGQQEAIIDIKLWDKVQQLIEAPYEAKKVIKGSEEAPLRLFVFLKALFGGLGLWPRF